jgi:hypothetical protein
MRAKPSGDEPCGESIRGRETPEGPIATEAGSPPVNAVLADIYSGARAPLRPAHKKRTLALWKFGPFGTVPKKGYRSS